MLLSTRDVSLPPDGASFIVKSYQVQVYLDVILALLRLCLKLLKHHLRQGLSHVLYTLPLQFLYVVCYNSAVIARVESSSEIGQIQVQRYHRLV